MRSLRVSSKWLGKWLMILGERGVLAVGEPEAELGVENLADVADAGPVDVPVVW